MASETGSSTSKVTWVVPETASKLIARDARDGQGKVEPQGQWTPPADDDRLAVDDGDRMEPLMAIGLIIATGWLVDRIWTRLSDQLRPESQIVDLRQQPPLILSAPHIKPAGTLLVIKLVNGEPTEERYTPDRRNEALDVLPKLLA